MTTVIITQPMLFPWPGFFEQLQIADIYIYLDDAQFSKGSFTNRVQLKIADQIKWLTIPLANKGTFQSICDLQPAASDWRQQHRAQLTRSLVDKPYAQDALTILDKAYEQEKICDALIQSIELTASYLKIGENRKIFRSSDLNISGSSWKRVLDIVHKFEGTRYITGHGAARYLDHEAFEAEGICVEYIDYSLTAWPQGSSSFTPYVSILDLIGTTGKQAHEYLHSKTTPWRKFLEKQ